MAAISSDMTPAGLVPAEFQAHSLGLDTPAIDSCRN
jgi:hypothetical protein